MLETMKIGEQDGFDLYLLLEEDDLADIQDDEGLTEKQKQAYKNGEWQYVVAIVEAHKFGLCLGEFSYGMVEYGELPITDQNDNLLSTKYIGIEDINNYVAEEIAVEALSNAEIKLKQIKEN